MKRSKIEKEMRTYKKRMKENIQGYISKKLIIPLSFNSSKELLSPVSINLLKINSKEN